MKNVRENIMEAIYPTNGDFFIDKESYTKERERFIWQNFNKIKFRHFYTIRDNTKAIYENKVGDSK